MRRMAVLLAFVTAVPLLAACGDKATALETVQAAASKTAVDTAKVSGTVTSTATGSKPIVVDGAFDFGAGRGRFSFDPVSLGIPGMTDPIDAVLAGSVMYMHFPQLAEQTGEAGKEWVKIDLQAA